MENRIAFQLLFKKAGYFNLNIYDALGKAVWQYSGHTKLVNCRIEWKQPANGVYVVLARQGGDEFTQRFSIMR
jgi:hypothetical protein